MADTLPLPDQPDVLLRASGLRLGYGRHVVLDGCSLEVKRGELWCLLGSNGAGKTTFVRTVIGLLPPLGGSLWRNPQAATPAHIGFVPQRCELNRSLPTTIAEFVSLGMVGLATSRLAERLDWSLRCVDLGDMQQQSYWSLSGGQRQRALLARALIREPRILILDEPTTGLDPVAEANLLQRLDELRQERRLAILLVTHDLNLARRHATHVALFEGGKVAAGAAAEMLTGERLREVFGRDLEAAMVGGHHH